MPEETAPAAKGTCFVVMGFGKKTDFETGRNLDLDKTYKYIIKPAVIAAGLKCVRADEIEHSGLIDVPMYEELLGADVVIADLSTSNKNAFYELGVRHALRPSTTIVICEDGIKTPPFDVNHILIRQYHHMGEGIDFGEVERFRDLLSNAISKIYAEDPRPKDSPVYTFLENLDPPERNKALKGVAEAAAKASPAAVGDAGQGGGMIYSDMMEQADEAQKDGDFITAKALLSRLRRKMKEAAGKAVEEATRKGIEDVSERPEDPYIIQRLALVTYKSKHPNPQAALEEARELLKTLNPETSNDTETLGLWGAVHKRLWDVTADPEYLNEAVRGYERGFYLRNDYYNGINLAYLLNIRAANAASRAEAIADFVQAERVRREVIKVCQQWLASEKLPVKESELQDKFVGESKYWVMASLAEAYVGIGDEANAQQKLQEAFSIAPAGWMKESTEEQTTKLRQLLADSPLKHIKTDGQ
jgi:hypothetical protein